MPALNRRVRPELFRGRQDLLWLGLLGLVVIWFFTLLLAAPKMEREIGSGVIQHLHAAGYQRLLATVSGRDVTLTGRVSGRHAAQDAATLAATVAGVRVVSDATVDLPLGLPWLRAVRVGEGRWRLAGRLPDVASRGRVLAAFSDGGQHDAANLLVDVETADAPWLAATESLVAIAGSLDRAGFELGAGNLEVAGRLMGRSRYEALMERLETLAAAHDLHLVRRIATLPEQQ